MLHKTKTAELFRTTTLFYCIIFPSVFVYVCGGVFLVYTLPLYTLRSMVCHKRHCTIRKKYDIWIKINHLNALYHELHEK